MSGDDDNKLYSKCKSTFGPFAAFWEENVQADKETLKHACNNLLKQNIDDKVYKVKQNIDDEVDKVKNLANSYGYGKSPACDFKVTMCLAENDLDKDFCNEQIKQYKECQ